MIYNFSIRIKYKLFYKYPIKKEYFYFYFDDLKEIKKYMKKIKKLM